MTPTPQPPQPATPPAPASPSKVAVAVGGGSLVLLVVDRLLGDQALVGELLQRLIAAPALASWPVVAVIAVIAWWGSGRWQEAQAARKTEAAALAASVGEVATGLGALRGEVASLRGDLRAHADSVDARFASSSGEVAGVRAEVSALAGRVGKLERRRRRPAT